MTPPGGNAGEARRLREVYVALYKANGTLPDELGRQRPNNVFFLFEKLNEKDKSERSVPPALAALYGL